MKRAIGLLAPFAAVFVLIAIAMCAVACASTNPEAAVEHGAQTAGGVATALTGNPAIGMAVTTLVGAVGGWFVGKRKKEAPA